MIMIINICILIFIMLHRDRDICITLLHDLHLESRCFGLRAELLEFHGALAAIDNEMSIYKRLI